MTCKYAFLHVRCVMEALFMKTTVTSRAQTVVPAVIRKRYGIRGGDMLEWIDDGEIIKVIPVPRDVLTELRGCAKGEKLLNRLINERQKDQKRESQKR